MTNTLRADVAQPPVFQIRQLTKVYPMDEVSVHALRGIDLEVLVLTDRICCGPRAVD